MQKISKGIVQTAVILFGSIVASGLSAVSLIIITRQLGPQNFGEFSVGFAILLMLVRLNDLGMTNTVQRFAAQEKDPEKINRLFSLATRIKLLGALVITVCGVLFSAHIATALHFSHPTIILLAFVLSTATTLYEHVQAMLQSLHRFAQSSLVNVTQAVVKVLGAGALLLSHSSAAIPTFSWYTAAPATPILLFPLLFPGWVKINPFKKYAAEFKLIKKHAFHSAFAFVSAGIIENVDVLFVQKYLNTYETGLLGGVSRIALLFSILAYALSSVLNPRVAQYTNKKDLRAFFMKGLLLTLAVGVGFLLFMPLSKWVLLYTIGSAYLPGLSILNILVAASLLTVAVVPFIALFFSFDIPWYFSLSGVLQLVIIVVGNGIFVPEYGLAAAAWTRLAARLALFVFTLLLAVYMYKKTYATRRT